MGGSFAAKLVFLGNPWRVQVNVLWFCEDVGYVFRPARMGPGLFRLYGIYHTAYRAMLIAVDGYKDLHMDLYFLNTNVR